MNRNRFHFDKKKKSEIFLILSLISNCSGRNLSYLTCSFNNEKQEEKQTTTTTTITVITCDDDKNSER